MRQDRVCVQCGESFVAVRNKQEFCKAACRYVYHNEMRRRKVVFAEQAGFSIINSNPNSEDFFSTPTTTTKDEALVK